MSVTAVRLEPSVHAPQPYDPSRAADATVLVTLLYWASVLTWGWGGRDARVLSFGVALLLASIVVVRPWTSLSGAWLLLPNLISAAAVLVVLTSPTGWAGRHDAASYIFASQLFLVVAAWCSDERRRLFVLGVVVAAGGAQFAQGWLAFWGKGDPAGTFLGTFYWHNQVGIYLAAAAISGLGLVCLRARSPYPLLSWVLAPVCITGVVFTTSRGSQLALALAALVLLVCCVFRHDRLACLVRWSGLLTLSALVTFGFSGPPFFASRAALGAGTAARGETLHGNGMQRLEDWRRAWEIFLEWPVSGAGFLSFRSAAAQVTDLRDGNSVASAHNGFLQALSDGGLVLALPLWAAVVFLLLWCIRNVPSSVRSLETSRTVAFAVLIALVLHSGMDFDWSYPALFALASILAGVVVGGRQPQSGGTSSARAAAVAAVALLSFAAVAGWTGGFDRNVPVEVER